MDIDEVKIPEEMKLEIWIHDDPKTNLKKTASDLLEECSCVLCNGCKNSKFRLGCGRDNDGFTYLTGNFFCTVFLKNIVPFRCKQASNGHFEAPVLFDTTFGCGAYEEPETPSKLEQAAKLLEKR